MSITPRTASRSGSRTDFSSRDVCVAVGISYRILDYWDRCHVLSPSVSSAGGSGAARRYSARDLDLALVLDALRRLGAKTDVLGSVARNLSAVELLEGTLAVSAGGDVSLGDGPPSWAAWWCVQVDDVLGRAELELAS